MQIILVHGAWNANPQRLTSLETSLPSHLHNTYCWTDLLILVGFTNRNRDLKKKGPELKSSP
jgi:hypothetical protein